MLIRNTVTGLIGHSAVAVWCGKLRSNEGALYAFQILLYIEDVCNAILFSVHWCLASVPGEISNRLP